MSELPAVPASPAGIWPMYRALVGVGLACALLIVGVYESTRPVIARNRAEALRRAVFRVLPGSVASATYQQAPDGGFARIEGDSQGAARVHAGYDAEGELVGVALEASGMGYQDVIRLLYGYSFGEQAVIGIRVLESRETPGLGDKIETDTAFLENFVRLAVPLSEDGTRIAQPIEAVKKGTKEHAWQIDGITGATISSVAIASILARSTAERIPGVHAGRDSFRGGE